MIDSAIPWMYGTIAKPVMAESHTKESQLVKAERLKQSSKKFLGYLFSFKTLMTYWRSVAKPARRFSHAMQILQH